MIFKLKNEKIFLVPMQAPEAMDNVYIQYEYETGTNHLTPKLTVENNVYYGNRVFIDLRRDIYKKVLTFTVQLYNSDKMVVRTYTGKFPLHSYIVLGPKLVRPDMETYIKYLEEKIDQLENEGEVI
jgi:hypothetical protein